MNSQHKCVSRTHYFWLQFQDEKVLKPLRLQKNVTLTVTSWTSKCHLGSPCLRPDNFVPFVIGLRGAPKISVLRGSHCTVRVSIREFRISVRFVLYIALSKQQWWRWKIIFPLRLAIVNDIVSYL